MSTPVDSNIAPMTATVSLKLPPYWPADPQVWFAQVEAQFANRGISAESTKYNYVISTLTPEIAQEVRDLLLNPPQDTPYKTLREELIKRTTATEQKRLKQLLTDEVLGDRKPTQLLRHMRQLLGDKALEDSILRQLFLQRLPASVQLVLTSAGDTMKMEQLAELADKVMDVSTHSLGVNSVTPVTPMTPPATTPTMSAQPTSWQNEVEFLRGEINRLTTEIKNIETRPRRSRFHSRHRSDKQPRTNTPSPSTDGQGMCWYHTTFGTNAHKCIKPCSHHANNQGNDQAGN